MVGGRTALGAAAVSILLLGASTSAAGPTAPPRRGNERGSALGTQLWVHRYNGSGDDFDYAHDVGVSPDGSRVFVTGTSSETGSGYEYATFAYDAATGSHIWKSLYTPLGGYEYGVALSVSPGGSKVFVTGSNGHGIATLGYDATTGSQLWASTTGGDQPYDIGVSPDGSRVFVTGGVYGPNGYDYVTAAYDSSNGAILWSSRYDGKVHYDDIPHALAVAPGGSTVFVTGGSVGPGFDCGAFHSGCMDFATVAYDASSGASRWVRRWSGPTGNSDTAMAIAMSPGGKRVFVTGLVDEGSSRWGDIGTLAYDTATGRQEWGVRYNDPDDNIDSPAAIAVSPGGSKVFVTGYSYQGLGDAYDYATVAYSASTGAQLWASRYDGTAVQAVDYAAAIAVSPEGSKVFVTGRSDDDGTNDDYATVAYDASTGAQLWASRYDGGGNPPDASDEAGAIALSPDGSTVFVTGESQGVGSGLAAYDYATVAYSA
jgi:DNA-binding beta-propeller fold protein YncE